MLLPRVRRVAALRAAALALLALATWCEPAAAQQTWYVAPGGTGSGASSAPFGRIQQGLQAAQPGDIVLVAAGTYVESLSTVRAGAPDAPITVRAASPRGVLVTRAGQVLQVGHPDVVIDGLVFDGQYAAADAIKVASSSDRLWLRNVEVRRSGRDCIDMGAPEGVRIEDSLIHRCLWWNGGREDAHGIVAGAVHGLRIRNVEIHTFSGDAIQLDPGRSLPGWDDVVIERSRLHLAPLVVAEGGFAAGVVPGENAIDTKTHPAAPRARLTVRDTEAFGFRNGLISNMAAFNLKENIEATLDGVTVSGASIAFRLRGPGSNGGAWVRLRNIVVHDVATAVRYEDAIELVEVTFATIGAGVSRVFQAANSGWAGVEVSNSVVLGSVLPVEAPAAEGNMAATAAAFVSASTHDYRPASGSPLLDRARVVAGLTTDRAGAPRVQGPAPDIGAYERPVTAPTVPALSGAPLATDPTNTARLTWTNLSGETGYELERSSDGQAFVRLTTRKADATSYNNSRLPSGRTYWYRVRALTAAGPQPYSNVVAVTLAAEGAAPPAPTALTATPSLTTTATVLLGWVDASINEDGFAIERSTDGLTFSRVATRDVNATSYTNSNLSRGALYYYRVRAYNGVGTGPASPVVAVQVP